MYFDVPSKPPTSEASPLPDLPSFSPISNAWRKTAGDVDLSSHLHPHTRLLRLSSSCTHTASSFKQLVNNAESLLSSNVLARSFLRVAHSQSEHITSDKAFDFRDSLVRRSVDCKLAFLLRLARSASLPLDPWNPLQYFQKVEWKLEYAEVGVGYEDAILVHKAATITGAHTLPPRHIFVETDE